MDTYELTKSGTAQRVGPFGSISPTVKAKNKTDAQTQFLRFAFNALDHTPEVRIKNGAYQLAYMTLGYGVNVESGVEGRKFALCLSGVSDWTKLNDSVASFDYYASDAYRQNMAA